MTESRIKKPAKAPRPFWRRILKWPIRIVVALVVLILVAWGLGNYWSARFLRAEVAKIRAAGEPLTFADLADFKQKPDDTQDAGRFYGAAMSLVRRYPVDARDLKSYVEAVETGKIAPEDMSELQRQLDGNRLALEMLDEGTKLPGCNYTFGLRRGIDAHLHGFGTARAVANAASLRTRLLSYQGKGDGATASAVSGLRLQRVFDREPILIDYLVKIACLTLSCQDIQVLLTHGHPSTEALTTLDSDLTDAERTMDPRRMFVVERVYELEVARKIIEGVGEREPSLDDGPPLPEQWPATGGPFVRVMVAQGVATNTRLVDAAGKGWSSLMDTEKAIDAETRTSWYPWVRIVGPSFGKVVNLAVHSAATLRCTRAAVRIEQYRLANGRLPDSLGQLPDAGEMLTDPMTGKSLIYRKWADGYCVYSVGDDRKDDGGRDLYEKKPKDWGVRIGKAEAEAGTQAAGTSTAGRGG